MEEVAGYTIDTRKLLGRGGFGEVFVAFDKNIQRVAAKRVWLKTTSSLSILAEVKTLRNLKPHKHILGYLTSEMSKDFLWIFTEYCEEGDLSQYCATHELNFTHKLEVGYQSASAVAHLHGLDPAVVHRDIKPNNILMTHNAERRMEVKLADFGLAKTASGMGRTLAMRTICGTEDYMAPEHFFMERRVASTYGRSVDIYALGLVLNALLDAIPGKPLLPIQVRDEPLGLIMYRMTEQRLPIWSPVTLDVDDDALTLKVKALISAMLSHNPESRPTAKMVEDKLHHMRDLAPASDALPRSTESNGHDLEDYFCREHTSQQEATVVRKPSQQQATVVRKLATKRRREFKSPARGLNIRATVDLGSPMHLRGPKHKFIMVGGSTGYNTSDLCWELDTPDDGFFWKCFNEVPAAMRGQFGYSVCAIDDKSFAIAGGSNSSKCEAACFLYTVVTSGWEKLPNTSTARCSAGLACLNKVLYFLGGEGNCRTVLKSCEKLELRMGGARRRWQRCTDMIQAMVFPLTAVAGDSIYVVSNTHRDNKIRPGSALTLQSYHPKQDKWSYQASLPTSIRDTSGASVLGDAGNLYLLAGWEKLCARYEVDVDVWTLLQPCPSIHSFAAVCCAGGKINVFGGQDEQGPTSVIDEYDIDANKWRVRTLEMPEPIVYHHALVLYM